MDSLLLDINYMAISVINWKRTLGLIIRGKAERVGDGVSVSLKCATKTIEVPSIIRLLKNIPYNRYGRRIRFSRRNVILRDNYTCQYCGIKLSKGGWTLDHVIPRCRNGKTDYLNCVACCKRCNSTKGQLTPHEANMKLLSIPKNPSFSSLHKNLFDNIPVEWKDFISGV